MVLLVLVSPWSNFSRWDGLIGLSALIFLAAVIISWWRHVRDRRLTESGGIDSVQLDELRIGESPLLVDLRPESVFRSSKGHIRGALNIPFETLPRRIKDVDMQNKRPVVLVDEGDERLLEAGALLRDHGIQWLYLLKGGMKAWRRKGHPLEQFTHARKA